MEDVIRGLWVAVATPLDPAGGVDQEALVRHCQWLLANDCDGLALFGTTGEGPSFGSSERLAAAEAVLQAGIPASRISLGTGCSAIPEDGGVDPQRAGTRADARADRAAVLFPRRHRAGDRGRFRRHHRWRGIREAAGHPLPHPAGGRRASAGGGAGAAAQALRQAGGRREGQHSHRRPGEFQGVPPGGAGVRLRRGSEVDIWRSLQLGGTGSINGMSNVVPGLVRAMFNSAGAEVAMRKAANLLAGLPFASAVKSVLAAKTGDAAWRRCGRRCVRSMLPWAPVSPPRWPNLEAQAQSPDLRRGLSARRAGGDAETTAAWLRRYCHANPAMKTTPTTADHPADAAWGRARPPRYQPAATKHPAHNPAAIRFSTAKRARLMPEMPQAAEATLRMP